MFKRMDYDIMKTTITKEIELITCDICGKESDIITKCRVCGKDICNHHRIGNQCIECWKDNCSFATITSNTTEESGYESRSYTTTIIKHESQNKWKDLLSRFQGKRVKITIEEFPKHEEVKINYTLEEMVTIKNTIRPLKVKPIEGIEGTCRPLHYER